MWDIMKLVMTIFNWKQTLACNENKYSTIQRTQFQYSFYYFILVWFSYQYLSYDSAYANYIRIQSGEPTSYE